MNLQEIIFGAILLWLSGSALYVFIYAISGYLYKVRTKLTLSNYPKCAVLIPAYKEDGVIYDSALSASLHIYKGDFDVIVIADSLKKSTLLRLSHLNVKVVEVAFEKSTKSRAINKTLEVIGDDYDVAVVLDADNVMKKNFLNEIGKSIISGSKVVQGHRMAKNLDSNFAYLDAISEEVNNHIYSKGPVALGLSSRIAGSGVGIEFSLFKEVMKSVDAIGGFDKELELKFIDKGYVIDYNHMAMVLDEKVKKPEVYQKQRTRWLSSQYFYLRVNALTAIKNLFSGKWDYFYKYLQLALPPRLFIPVLLMGCIFLSLFFANNVFMTISVIAFMLNVVAYLIAIPKDLFTSRLVAVSVDLFKAIFVTLLAMLNLKGANKKFIHTPHSN